MKYLFSNTGRQNVNDALEDKFRVLLVGHDITIYPLIMSIDEDMAHEIGTDRRIEILSEDDFVMILEKVLKSKRMALVVNSIINLSK